jgi:acyl-coenzyme A thioesterase PaaI-like protein
MKVNYITPAPLGLVKAKGRIIHKGSRLAVGEAVVFEENKTVAKGLVTYMILDGRVGA